MRIKQNDLRTYTEFYKLELQHNKEELLYTRGEKPRHDDIIIQVDEKMISSSISLGTIWAVSLVLDTSNNKY